MKLKKSLYALAIAGACSASVYAQTPTLTYTLTESGANVVLTVTGQFGSSGSLPSGWTIFGSTQTGSSSFIEGDLGLLGTINSANTTVQGYYYSSTAAQTIGPGSTLYTGTRDLSGVNATAIISADYAFGGAIGNKAGVWVDPSYTFGNAISGQGTFSNKTLAQLGVTANQTTSYTLGGQSFVITTVGASPVPEASGSVAGLGLAVAGLYQLGRRRQNTVTQ